MMDDRVLFDAFMAVLKMLDKDKSIDEICRFFNISTDFLFNSLFARFKFARSARDFTTKDLEKMRKFEETHTDVYIRTSFLSGARYIQGKRLDGEYEQVVLTPQFVSPVIVRFVEAGADFETLKKISYGDITVLKRLYNFATEPLFIEDKSGKIGNRKE